MTRFLLVLGVLFCMMTAASAHSTHALSVRLHQLAVGDVIEVIAPTPSVQAAMDAHFGSALAIDSREGKERYVRYLKETVEVQTPEGKLALGGGGIRVDGHQVVVRLKAVVPDGERFPMEVHAPVLAENRGQLVTFRLVGQREGHVVLDAGDGFRATLTERDGAIAAR
ncbi:MAG: hypothetical protein EP330_16410 [Deltaproteobacteria bacterium]|nr:MAG: hypothetical protein EP330_16410 [Deltaproteobacteria bacterium]